MHTVLLPVKVYERDDADGIELPEGRIVLKRWGKWRCSDLVSSRVDDVHNRRKYA